MSPFLQTHALVGRRPEHVLATSHRKLWPEAQSGVYEMEILSRSSSTGRRCTARLISSARERSGSPRRKVGGGSRPGHLGMILLPILLCQTIPVSGQHSCRQVEGFGAVASMTRMQSSQIGRAHVCTPVTDVSRM